MQFDHFELVPLELKYAERFHTMMVANKEQLLRFFPITSRRTKTLRATKSYIKSKKSEQKVKQFYGFLILDSKTENLAGYLLVKNLDWRVPKAELAYFVDKNYQQQGVGKAALHQLTNFCFEELKLNKLHIMMEESNEPSRRLGLACGFHQEGLLKKEFRTNEDELVDVYLLALLNPNLQ